MASAKKPTKKTPEKAAPKKAAIKKAAPKKVIAKNPVAKKTGGVKAALKKVVSKKTPAKPVPKKPEAKKPAPKADQKKVEKAAPVKKIVTPKVPDVFRCPVSGIPVKAEKPNLSDKTLAKLKESLEQERVRHLAQADELAQEAVDLIMDREAGDTQFDEESGEGDSIAVERERSLFLSAEARNTVDQIDRALQRMKDGTYGVCSPSKRRINVARLEALPWADICIDCKSRSERRR